MSEERRTIRLDFAAWILGCSILGCLFACAQALWSIAAALERLVTK